MSSRTLSPSDNEDGLQSPSRHTTLKSLPNSEHSKKEPLASPSRFRNRTSLSSSSSSSTTALENVRLKSLSAKKKLKRKKYIGRRRGAQKMLFSNDDSDASPKDIGSSKGSGGQEETILQDRNRQEKERDGIVECPEGERMALSPLEKEGTESTMRRKIDLVEGERIDSELMASSQKRLRESVRC